MTSVQDAGRWGPPWASLLAVVGLRPRWQALNPTAAEVAAEQRSRRRRPAAAAGLLRHPLRRPRRGAGVAQRLATSAANRSPAAAQVNRAACARAAAPIAAGAPSSASSRRTLATKSSASSASRPVPPSTQRLAHPAGAAERRPSACPRAPGLHDGQPQPSLSDGISATQAAPAAVLLARSVTKPAKRTRSATPSRRRSSRSRGSHQPWPATTSVRSGQLGGQRGDGVAGRPRPACAAPAGRARPATGAAVRRAPAGAVHLRRAVVDDR